MAAQDAHEAVGLLRAVDGRDERTPTIQGPYRDGQGGARWWAAIHGRHVREVQWRAALLLVASGARKAIGRALAGARGVARPGQMVHLAGHWTVGVAVAQQVHHDTTRDQFGGAQAVEASAVATVYRGFTGTVLPESFFHPNEDGVCGGVEYGFTSTSKVREHAQHYAGAPPQSSRNRMGMVDRGADFSWLSQYPHECEILFPSPLVGLEVLKTNVQGDTLEVESRFSLNMSAQTLEQVVSKRRKMLADMAHGMHFEVRNALVDLEGAKESGMMKKAWNEESADTRARSPRRW